MALPFKRGGNGNGGFLNGVTGEITAITFAANKTGETKKGTKYTTYSGKVTITPDGGEPVEQFMDAGFLYGDNGVSKDGRTITGKDDYALDANSVFGQFIESLVVGEGNRLPEEALGNLRNYDGVAGARVVFARVKDEEATVKRGTYKLGAKAKTATREQLIEAGKRVDKKDPTKRYMLDKLLVTEVLSAPAGKSGKAKAAATTKATATKAGSADTSSADTVLKAILETAGGELARKDLSAKVVRYALSAGMEGSERDALRAVLISDEYLTDAQDRNVIVLDGEGAKQMIIAAEVTA